MKVNEVSAEKQLKTIIEANKILNKYSNHDPFYIARKLGIGVIFTKLTANVKAFIIQDALGVTIYINELADGLSRKILCAHELGHYFNGDIDHVPAFFDIDIDPEKEYLANLFMTIILPQAESRLDANSRTDISDINRFFDNQITYYKHTEHNGKELMVLNDSSTIFDV